MTKKTADWQNHKVPLLNCLGNDVKLNIIKTARFAGKFPVDDTLKFKKLLHNRTFRLDDDRERSHSRAVRSAFGKLGFCVSEDIALVGFGGISSSKTRV